MEYSDCASKDSLLSLSLVDVICSYDHFKSCFLWCLDNQTPGLGAQAGLSVRNRYNETPAVTFLDKARMLEEGIHAAIFTFLKKS